MPLSSPLAVSLTVTMPPPAVPSTSMRVELGLQLLHLGLQLRGLLHHAHEISHCSVPFAHDLIRKPVRHSSRSCASPPRYRMTTSARVGCIGGRLRHADDLGAGETVEHRLHQRIALHAALELGLPCVASARARSARPPPSTPPRSSACRSSRRSCAAGRAPASLGALASSAISSWPSSQRTSRTSFCSASLVCTSRFSAASAIRSVERV